MISAVDHQYDDNASDIDLIYCYLPIDIHGHKVIMHEYPAIHNGCYTKAHVKAFVTGQPKVDIIEYCYMKRLAIPVILKYSYYADNITVLLDPIEIMNLEIFHECVYFDFLIYQYLF